MLFSSTWTRTKDPRINNPLLYQLSYRGITGGAYQNRTGNLCVQSKRFPIKLTPHLIRRNLKFVRHIMPLVDMRDQSNKF